MASQEDQLNVEAAGVWSAPAARFELSGFDGYRKRVVGDVRVIAAEAARASCREDSRWRWHEVDRHEPRLASRQAVQVTGECSAKASRGHPSARTHAGSPRGELEARRQLQCEHHVRGGRIAGVVFDLPGEGVAGSLV